MATRSEFVNQIYRAALGAGLTDAAARVMAAQAAHESAFGSKAPGYNFFGIKAGKSWTGETQTLWTHEVVDGKREKVLAKFRAYETPEAAIADRVDFMSSFFPGFNEAETIGAALDSLQNGKFGRYYTDSPAKYERSINAINSQYLDGSSALSQGTLTAPATLRTGSRGASPVAVRGGGRATSSVGGPGGTTAASVGAVKRAGGRGGNGAVADDRRATGGGGAAGPDANGVNGTNQSGTGASKGGDGNGGKGGVGSAGGSEADGGSGAEFDPAHGTGGGGGGFQFTNTQSSPAAGNSGGKYGGGGGGVTRNGTGRVTKAGDGGGSLIVLTYAPKSARGFNMPNMGL